MNIQKQKATLGVHNLITNINKSPFFVIAQVDNLDQAQQTELYKQIQDIGLTVKLIPRKYSNKLKSLYIEQLLTKLWNKNHSQNNNLSLTNELFAARYVFNNNILFIYTLDNEFDAISGLNKLSKINSLTLFISKINNSYVSYSYLEKLLKLKDINSVKNSIVGGLLTPLLKLPFLLKHINSNSK